MEAEKVEMAVRVYTDTQDAAVRKALAAAARVPGQELKVTATEEGWVVEVYSAWDEQGDNVVRLLVPKDKGKDALVVQKVAL
jgi:hypothetical protein